MIPVQQAHIHISAQTHAGLTGKNNEDRYAVTAFNTPDSQQVPTVFAVVADGIGGHQAGEVAAELAVNSITSYIAESDGKDPLTLISQGIGIANQAIHAEADKDPMRQGMGSTCACAWVIKDQLYISSVGDSRIYLQRGGELFRLTKDHTWIQDALENGIITPEQAKDHPRAHIIRRFLGSPNPINPDMGFHTRSSSSEEEIEFNQGMHLNPRDQVLLCSDGLTDLVQDDEIQEILFTKQPDTAVNDLLALANQRGGHDNITIVILTVPQKGAMALQTNTGRSISRNLACIGLIGLSSLIVAGGLLIWYFAGQFLGLPPFPLTDQNRPTLTAEPRMTTEAQTDVIIPDNQEATSGVEEPGITPIPGETSPSISGPTPTYTPWPTNTLAPDS